MVYRVIPKPKPTPPPTPIHYCNQRGCRIRGDVETVEQSPVIRHAGPRVRVPPKMFSCFKRPTYQAPDYPSRNPKNTTI